MLQILLLFDALLNVLPRDKVVLVARLVVGFGARGVDAWSLEAFGILKFFSLLFPGSFMCGA